MLISKSSLRTCLTSILLDPRAIVEILAVMITNHHPVVLLGAGGEATWWDARNRVASLGGALPLGLSVDAHGDQPISTLGASDIVVVLKGRGFVLAHGKVPASVAKRRRSAFIDFLPFVFVEVAALVVYNIVRDGV